MKHIAQASPRLTRLRSRAASGAARMLALALLTLAPPACGALLYAPAARAEGPCPNAEFRTGNSASLPDCRAYEQVSPAAVEPYFESNGNPGNLVGRGIRALGQTFGSQASVSGERLLFYSPYGLAGAVSDGFFFLSTRGPAGWSTENMIPPQSVSNNEAGCSSAYVPLRAPEFTNWVLADGYGQGDRGGAINENYCATDEPLLLEGEPQGFQNLFLHDAGAGVQAGSYQLIDTLAGAPAGTAADDAWAQGASGRSQPCRVHRVGAAHAGSAGDHAARRRRSRPERRPVRVVGRHGAPRDDSARRYSCGGVARER